MRILFVVFSRSGHLHPMLAVAGELERRGHEVVLFSLGDDVGPIAARAGLRARTGMLATATAAGATALPAEPQRSLAVSERANDLAWAKRFNRLTLLDPVPSQVAQLSAVVADLAIDALAIDPLAYAGAVVAERLGLPWACLVTGLQSLTVAGVRAADAEAFDQLADRRAAMIASLGVDLAFRGCDVVSPRCNLLFAYDQLFAAGSPPGLTCVGPAVPAGPRGDEPAFDWAALPADRPIVYISFGSQLSPPPAVYEALWASLSADEAVFVTALKDLRDEPFARARPAHVIAVDYAPQLALLERAAVMVQHGGANSVMEALARGCPMLVIPLAYDQPLLAHLVAQAGAGAALARDQVTPARCRELLLPMLARDAPARVQARAIGEPGATGADRAARGLIELVTPAPAR